MEEYEVVSSFAGDVSDFSLSLSEKVATAIGTLFFGWIAVHFANDFGKNFVYVHLVPGRSFNERAIPSLGQSQTLHGGYFSLMLQVNFVPNQQQWHTVCALDTGNLKRRVKSCVSHFNLIKSNLSMYLFTHGLDVLKGLVISY